jgi:hypothetical protein
MSRAIIQNSDYQSAEECRLAIDRYFNERNENFKDPKRAGNKIWGKNLLTRLWTRGITAKILDGKFKIAINEHRILQTRPNEEQPHP